MEENAVSNQSDWSYHPSDDNKQPAPEAKTSAGDELDYNSLDAWFNEQTSKGRNLTAIKGANIGWRCNETGESAYFDQHASADRDEVAALNGKLDACDQENKILRESREKHYKTVEALLAETESWQRTEMVMKKMLETAANSNKALRDALEGAKKTMKRTVEYLGADPTGMIESMDAITAALSATART